MTRWLTPLTDEQRAGLDDRLVPKGIDEGPAKSYRTSAQRDRDRILYSSALHRLAYVTQVTQPESGYTFHNRLSHSLKVAQVGRRNAERLQYLVREGAITGAAAALVNDLDPDAVEASCLAHDLGHPPFGHVAEEALNAAAKQYAEGGAGFEGNAQSFRIVTRLAIREYTQDGLNLTRRTLNGLLKYPWRHWAHDPAPGHKRQDKWGYYTEDTEAFSFARSGWPAETDRALPERCLEAEIMDWADDLTYAVHDVDDFYRAGLIPLHSFTETNGRKRLEHLLAEAKEAEPGAFPDYSISDLSSAVERAVETVPLAPYEHDMGSRAAMRAWGSDRITQYLDAFELVDDPTRGEANLTIRPEAKCEVEALKMLVWVYVIRRPALAVVQHGQRRIVRELFRWYYEASRPTATTQRFRDMRIRDQLQRYLVPELAKRPEHPDRRLFPPSAKEWLERGDDSPAVRARVAVDLVSGLTERAAVELHRRLSGDWSGPTLDATAQIG